MMAVTLRWLTAQRSVYRETKKNFFLFKWQDSQNKFSTLKKYLDEKILSVSNLLFDRPHYFFY